LLFAEKLVNGLDGLSGSGDHGVLGHFDFELHGGVVLDEFERFDRKVLRIIGEQGDLHQHGGHFGVVENRCFCFSSRVDKEKRTAGVGFKTVPEAISRGQPPGETDVSITILATFWDVHRDARS
jgi:hypothetical protein